MINSSEISVILPFYNAEQTLNRAIQSISQQSYSNFECILVNNNATDSSLQIAQNQCKKDKRFVLIHENKQGVMYASNAGCSAAKGKYIARMDADDESLPHRLQEQYQFLEKHPEFDVVTGMVQYMRHRENTEGFLRYVIWVNSLKNHQDIFNQRFVDAPIINPTTMWRKSTEVKLGLYRGGDFPEDYEMWLRWLSKGVKIGKLNKSILRWYDSDTRLTRTHSIYRNEAFYKIKTKYLAEYLKNTNPLYPKVAVWGASRISRKWINLLEQEGLDIALYIDTNTKRQLDKQVIHYKSIPRIPEYCILVYMKHETLKSNIRSYLLENNYTEGLDFFLLS